MRVAQRRWRRVRLTRGVPPVHARVRVRVVHHVLVVARRVHRRRQLAPHARARLNVARRRRVVGERPGRRLVERVHPVRRRRHLLHLVHRRVDRRRWDGRRARRGGGDDGRRARLGTRTLLARAERNLPAVLLRVGLERPLLRRGREREERAIRRRRDVVARLLLLGVDSLRDEQRRGLGRFRGRAARSATHQATLDEPLSFTGRAVRVGADERLELGRREGVNLVAGRGLQKSARGKGRQERGDARSRSLTRRGATPRSPSTSRARMPVVASAKKSVKAPATRERERKKGAPSS